MANTFNASKRQKVATVESALFNPDVVFLLAALLNARDLCQHGEEKSVIQSIPGRYQTSSALCSNHVMRSGKHFAVFTGRGSIGVIRPVQIKLSDFGEGGLNEFIPRAARFWGYLRGQRTARWTDSNVHCCSVSIQGISSWDDWISNKPFTSIDGFQRNIPIGLLLDLDEGTLSIYQKWSKAGDAE
ncbi:hypothetical protein THAOC_27602, partial [Thalassiosira oceanica]